MSKLISIIGSPHSGKSTLASQIHTKLKREGKNSIFVGEVATEFIANNGIPSTPIDQMVIFYKQLEKEVMFKDTKDYIVCDSSTLLNYFYFRKLFSNPLSTKDIYIINHLQNEILKTINQWTHIYYVPPIKSNNVTDGIRYHDENEISKIDKQIKSYLEIENIPHTDLSEIKIEDRMNFIINNIK